MASGTRFECVQCGNCCRQMAICVTYSDMIRWQRQGRNDVLEEVSFCKNAPQGEGFYFHRSVLKPKRTCPFLEDNLCQIHDTKPRTCKDAPKGFTRFDQCPVWDKELHFNLKSFKRTIKKQDKDFRKCVTQFDRLMEILWDSRSGN